jgi:uncharacterized protein DUF4440
MRRLFAASLIAGSITLVPGLRAAGMDAPSQKVQQDLIALDKKWGETLDKAVLEKMISDNMLAVGPEGQAGGKKEQIAEITSTPSTGYMADEYKFEMLTPDIVVMTHRGSSTSKANGKDVKESHRSLHVFQRVSGSWQAVASAQTPIAKP